MGRHQLDQHRNCFKSSIKKVSEKWGEAHMGFPERVDTTLKWTGVC